jgi:hypothetical protein
LPASWLKVIQRVEHGAGNRECGRPGQSQANVALSFNADSGEPRCHATTVDSHDAESVGEKLPTSSSGDSPVGVFGVGLEELDRGISPGPHVGRTEIDARSGVDPDAQSADTQSPERKISAADEWSALPIWSRSKEEAVS